MAIQIRRGPASDFDATKMVSGELAVSTDGTHKVWATGAAGDAWELANKEDLDTVEENLGDVAEDVSDLKDAYDILSPAATSADVGKALIVKTVEDGKVTEYEYGEAGAPPIKDTASGVIASFSDGADNVPMDGVIVTMEPVQDLHGYDNPWPAGGGEESVTSTKHFWFDVRRKRDV